MAHRRAAPIGSAARLLLAVGIAVDLGLLAFFKYADFLLLT